MPDSSVTGRARLIRLAVLVALYLAITLLFPRPATVSPEGWRLFGLFVATVAGLILQPVPGGALVLTAVTLAVPLGGLKLSEALAGYADSTVWLVMAAFFISRSLLNTGLARRIALHFVRLFGKSSMGIAYALSFTDMTLATIIPSNGARSGGVVLPIARSIAELYGSSPGETSGRLGSYLFLAVYQSICVSAAMFFTGQASNPLAAQMASEYYQVTWAGWFVAALVPGLLSIALTPWLVMRLHPPEVRHTPEAPEFARRELHNLGPMSRDEKILAVVFVAVCAMWVTSSFHKVDITLTALCGSVALLLTGVLSWDDVLKEKSAWDIFVWYGGLLQLGKSLNATGVTKVFANSVAETFSYLAWLPLLLVALLVFYYSHYAFASITAHLLAMYPAFLAVLILKGAPAGVVVYSFAVAANLSAGLTNYGTTPAPMFFAQGYVPLPEWWRVGFIVSLLHVAVWGTVGFAWWKALGLW